VRSQGLRRPLLAFVVAISVLLAIGVAVARTSHHDTTVDAMPTGEVEGTAAIARHLANLVSTGALLAPAGSSNYIEGDRTSVDDEFLKRALPGNDIPAPVLQNSNRDWDKARGRGHEGSGGWTPLGPTWGKNLPNPFRDRSIYTAGTQDFSGRIAHVAIDPDCGSRGGSDDDDDDDDGGSKGRCRLWIANANGGVWRTSNALAKQPHWKYLTMVFEHNNVASLLLDPNDKNANTIWAGTGEPNACGSGCEAGVGLYKSTNGGNSWTGPYGKESFYDRAVGSIAIKPGNSNVMFAASGRAIRGLSNVCCGGADAIIPGAPHFGLWRSLDGGQSWQLVNQGATALCTAASPDVVSMGGTDCSARGARRVMIDPVDPNTVYASFFARGIWRSRSNGDPGTWEQIMPRVGPFTAPNGAQITTERAEFDVVKLPNGETRMYVGVGGGGLCGSAATPPLPSDECTVPAQFRRNDNVRSAPAATVAATWLTLTSVTNDDTPSSSSWGYCDPQCSYDNYVFAPAAHFPNSGANADTVYLSGANRYRENNWGPASPHCCPDNPAPGRGNGRAVAVSTDGGATFTDMTDDASDDVYPHELHPDHHALTVNPTNWKQFFDVGDGGIQRSNGVFVNDSGDCVQPKGYQGTRLTFCQLTLSRIPERLTAINKGLRTLHFYQLQNSPFNPDEIIGGTQDNGSWERGDTVGSGTNGSTAPPNSLGPAPTNCENDDDDHGGGQVWVQTNIADGGHNNFDIGDPCFRQTAWQGGQLMVAYTPKNALDQNWIADTLFALYGNEATSFNGIATYDRVNPHWLWTARGHVFRSTNQGRNPALTKEEHRKFCNVWYGLNFDNDQQNDFAGFCDDWKPLGDPGPNGRLTGAAYGADRPGGFVADIERATSDGNTLWAATSTGRVFVSKNADNPDPTLVTFDRIDNDPTATNTPPRYPTEIYIDPTDTNHAWITYSGFNAKTPGTPGHVFEVQYVPNASTFKILDGNQPRDALGDIPATSIAVSLKGTIYVGTDYGCIASKGNGLWRECGDGLPNLVVADLLYIPGQKRLYAATHGQGVWSLDVKGIEDDDRGRDNDKGKDKGKRRD
jgi:hypothetical protein